MRIYDISLTLTPGMPIWPGDPPLIVERASKMEDGAVNNVTHVSMCVHIGTHVDAPFHFLGGSAPSVEKLALKTLTGRVVCAGASGCRPDHCQCAGESGYSAAHPALDFQDAQLRVMGKSAARVQDRLRGAQRGRGAVPGGERGQAGGCRLFVRFPISRSCTHTQGIAPGGCGGDRGAGHVAGLAGTLQPLLPAAQAGGQRWRSGAGNLDWGVRTIKRAEN